MLVVALLTALRFAQAPATLVVEVLVGSTFEALPTHAPTLRIVGPVHQPVVAEALLDTVTFAGPFIVESDPQVPAVVAASCALTQAVDDREGGRPPVVVDANPDLIAAAGEEGGRDEHFVEGGVRVAPGQEPCAIHLHEDSSGSSDHQGGSILGTVSVESNGVTVNPILRIKDKAPIGVNPPGRRNGLVEIGPVGGLLRRNRDCQGLGSSICGFGGLGLRWQVIRIPCLNCDIRVVSFP